MEDYRGNLTTKQKLANFWDYGKIPIAIGLIAAVVLGYLVINFITANKRPGVSIIVAGVGLPQAMGDDFVAAEAYMGNFVPDTGKRPPVVFSYTALGQGYAPGSINVGGDAAMKLMTEMTMNDSYLLIVDQATYNGLGLSDVALPIGNYVSGLTLDDPTQLPITSLGAYSEDGPLKALANHNLFFVIKDIIGDKPSAKDKQRFDDAVAFLNNLASGNAVAGSSSSSGS